MNSNGVYVATVARTTVISSGLPPEIEFGKRKKSRLVNIKSIQRKYSIFELSTNQSH